MKTLVPTIHKWLFDYGLIFFVTTVLATGFAHQVLSKWQTIRTFYPHDGTLWNVYSSDSIHTAVLFVILYWVLTPLLYYAELHRISLLNPTTSTSIHNKTSSPSRQRSAALRVALGLLSCTMIAVLLVELGKGYVGGLRPFFGRVCFSSPASPSARTETHLLPPVTSDAECLTDNPKALLDARRSFPSGHAALAVSGATYGQLSLTRLARASGISSVKAAMVYAVGWLWLFFAAWVSASRVHDSAHHIGDVAVGALIGLWCGGVHFWYVIGREEAIQLHAQAGGRPQSTRRDGEDGSATKAE